MPFVKMQSKCTRHPDSPVLIAVYPSSNGSAVQFVFEGRLMKDCGWVPGDKIQFYEGTGPDHGVLHVVKEPTGYTLSQRGSDGGATVKFLSKMLKQHKVKVEKKSLNRRQA